MFGNDGPDDYGEGAPASQALRDKRIGRTSTEEVRSESVFKSFHVVYNIECDTEDDQAKVSRAATLTHEKYCGIMRMFRMIAPVSHEIAVVSTEPAKA